MLRLTNNLAPPRGSSNGRKRRQIGSLARLVERVGRAGMMRSIGVLISGTALAHAITAAAMPVATRLFTPQDFAAASTFSSLVGILVVAACLRYELAVPLPDDNV